MFIEPCTSDDLIEMTPPTARTLAQQERKRLIVVSVLMLGLFSLCVVAVSQLSDIITTHYPLGVISFFSTSILAN